MISVEKKGPTRFAGLRLQLRRRHRRPGRRPARPVPQQAQGGRVARQVAKQPQVLLADQPEPHAARVERLARDHPRLGRPLHPTRVRVPRRQQAHLGARVGAAL